MTLDDRHATEQAFNRELGARLRQARTDRGLSLTAAEEQSGGEFKASALGCYERGERSLTAFRLHRLSLLYDVPCIQLLGDGDGDGDGAPGAVEGRSVAASGAPADAVGALEAQTPVTISPSTPMGNAGRGRVILVVDDEASTRELVTTALKLEGYETMTAADGVMALEILSRCRFDVIVLDTVMPRMDGLTVLRTLRSDPATEHTPVLVFSGLADIAHLERAVEAGASGYITKPFEVRGLLEQIARLAKPSKRTRRR